MEFESESGNTYYYDNEIGMVFPSNPLVKKLISVNPGKAEEIAANEKKDDDLRFYSRFLHKLNKVRPNHDETKPRQPLSAEDIRPLILREGLHELILGVTEDCNLRCRYCIYSEVYSLSRNRSTKKMDFLTAKKALDYYASLFLEGRAYSPTRLPAVAFYGGEPLMNFDLIKRCVRYLETTYPELKFLFSFTTNGTLLTEEKDDFLNKHDFSINISIDGPEEEHNRKRVYPGNKGTFSDVMKNVRRLMKKVPDKIGAMCVFDYKTDPFELDAFFSRSDVPDLQNMTMPNEREGCTYYDQFTEEDKAAFMDTIAKAFRHYLAVGAHDKDADSFFTRYFGHSASRFLYSPAVLTSRGRGIIHYSGACIPGRKIFVDTNGSYHLCERIHEHFPIGNVKTGLDYQNIAALINRYNDHLKSCVSCHTNNVCGKCYTSFTLDGTFEDASSVCKGEEMRIKSRFSRVFTLGEACPELLNTLVRDYYTWLSRPLPATGD